MICTGRLLHNLPRLDETVAPSGWRGNTRHANNGGASRYFFGTAALNIRSIAVAPAWSTGLICLR